MGRQCLNRQVTSRKWKTRSSIYYLWLMTHTLFITRTWPQIMDTTLTSQKGCPCLSQMRLSKIEDPKCSFIHWFLFKVSKDSWINFSKKMGKKREMSKIWDEWSMGSLVSKMQFKIYDIGLLWVLRVDCRSQFSKWSVKAHKLTTQWMKTLNWR